MTKVQLFVRLASGRWMLGALITLFSFNVLAAKSCPDDLCRLAADGAYANLIVGKLVHVATNEEFEQVFHWAKRQKQWQHLPDTFDSYQKYVSLVSIQTTTDSKPIAVFLTREEYDAAPFEIGSLVRYRPHNDEWPAPESAEARILFYGLTGCVATLCAANDAACNARYLPGVYTLQGRAVDYSSNTVSSEKLLVDSDSLLPKKEKN